MILFFESSRSAEKILGSGKNATKIKSPRAALKRYSESGTIPLLKKKCVNSSSPQGRNEKILGSGKNTATKKKVYKFIESSRSAEKILGSEESTATEKVYKLTAI